MLLGNPTVNNTLPDVEPLINSLLLQQRYAEAYELLADKQPAQSSTLYNLALCLYWIGSYQAALNKLDLIHLAPNLGNGTRLNSDTVYQEIKNKQNLSDDHLHGIMEIYIQRFPASFQDAIIRLKIDCWSKIGDHAKVIATAAAVAHKGYKNISDALRLAQTANDK